MTTFDHSLARFAVWNLAGNTPLNPGLGIAGDSLKAENQAKGLALLDADFVSLVEVSPIAHIEWLAQNQIFHRFRRLQRRLADHHYSVKSLVIG